MPLRPYLTHSVIRKGDCMRIAVVGATGLVGGYVLEGLSRQEWGEFELLPFATEGRGRSIELAGREFEVLSLPDTPPEVDFAFFAVPNETARALVPAWNASGIRIIDKSSAYRMAKGVPLVVPEINGDLITPDELLIANPNCSTIQLAVALRPLQEAFGLEQVRVSTYQAVSGAGTAAVDAWRDEAYSNDPVSSPFPRRIHANVIPMIGSANEAGWFTEEWKVMQELPKILGAPELPVTCTAVRVPVEVGHSEAVEVRLGREVSLDEVYEQLRDFPGISLTIDPDAAVTPLEAAGDDEVHVGRLRIDPHDSRSLHLWVVSDNLRKGAATNALQILSRWMESLTATTTREG